MKNGVPLAAVMDFVRLGGAQPRWRDALVSGIGGCLAIVTVVLVCRRFVGAEGAALLVASMGASAVLLFALPDGPLSGPWAVVGGHVCSAIVGVLCRTTVSDSLLAAALAVGAAIGVMQLFRCVHPPGGATALSAVMGGSSVHALGMHYVLTPVLLNAAVIVIVAAVFNHALGRRRLVSFSGVSLGPANRSAIGLAGAELTSRSVVTRNPS